MISEILFLKKLTIIYNHIILINKYVIANLIRRPLYNILVIKSVNRLLDTATFSRFSCMYLILPIWK